LSDASSAADGRPLWVNVRGEDVRTALERTEEVLATGCVDPKKITTDPLLRSIVLMGWNADATDEIFSVEGSDGSSALAYYGGSAGPSPVGESRLPSLSHLDLPECTGASKPIIHVELNVKGEFRQGNVKVTDLHQLWLRVVGATEAVFVDTCFGEAAVQSVKSYAPQVDWLLESYARWQCEQSSSSEDAAYVKAILDASPLGRSCAPEPLSGEAPVAPQVTESLRVRCMLGHGTRKTMNAACISEWGEGTCSIEKYEKKCSENAGTLEVFESCENGKKVQRLHCYDQNRIRFYFSGGSNSADNTTKILLTEEACTS